MKKTFILTVLLAIACFGYVGTASADSITQGGVTYTFTAGESDGGGLFDVIVTIDTSGATASGTLTNFAVQFTGATSVTLESASSNTGGWTNVQPGGTSASGCDSTGNFWCASGPAIPVTSGGPGDTYTFVFDVNMDGGTLPTDSDIKAFQGQGDLAISSGVGIGTPGVPTPEPASLALLGLGLIGVPFLRRRK